MNECIKLVQMYFPRSSVEHVTFTFTCIILWLFQDIYCCLAICLQNYCILFNLCDLYIYHQGKNSYNH